MPINISEGIGGYGSGRVESILTGKASKWDALWLTFGILGAFMSTVSVIGIIAGFIVLIYGYSKRNASAKFAGFLMVLIGIFEFIAYLVGGTNTKKFAGIESGADVQGWDNFLYYANWTGLKTYNYFLSDVVPVTPNPPSNIAGSIGVIPSIE